MKVRVESAPSQGEHKASPLPCYGFASRCVYGGKGTFLSLHPEISLSVSFANRVQEARRPRRIPRLLFAHYNQHVTIVTIAYFR